MKLYTLKWSGEEPLFLHRWNAPIVRYPGGSRKFDKYKRPGLHTVNVVGLVTVIVAVMYLGRAWPAWVLMWAIAIVLGMFFKWLSWRDARDAGLPTPLGRTLGWFLLWPGMDGRAFFGESGGRQFREDNGTIPERAFLAVRTPATEWLAAFFKLALGCLLIWMVGPRVLAGQPLAWGWVGMVGIILILHFGLFHLLSLAWRAGGVDAAPIMNRPLVATALAQFWGERWNRAFSVPARRFLLLPLARRVGLSAASFAVFAASGLMHELVISVPARGGYGLPTAYFLLQGAGVWLERTKAGRALGFGVGAYGWLWTLVFAAGPAFWLFHPPFVHNVILPMLDAIGAP